MSDEICKSCSGPLWSKVVDQGVDIHNLGDWIVYLKSRLRVEEEELKSYILKQIDLTESALQRIRGKGVGE